ncbi:MAG: alpha/beta hydrolase [Nannocystaceae bacterium]
MPRPIDVRARGLTFRCLTAGDGPLVLLVHGFPDDATSFAPLCDELAAAGYRAVAPFTRGYAPTSAAADGDYSIAALGGDLIALIRALGADRATIVGHDWGAISGYAAANLAPAFVRDLITLAVPPLASFVGRARAAQLRRSWYIGLFQLPGIAERRLAADDFALIDRLWADWSPGWRAPAERLAAVKATFRRPGTVAAALAYYRALRPQLGRVDAWRRSRSLGFQRLRVPALVLAGGRDGCIGAETFAGAVATSDAPIDCRVLPGVGHFMHLEDPARLHALILERLAAQG